MMPLDLTPPGASLLAPPPPAVPALKPPPIGLSALAFTVVEVEEWAGLFVGDDLVDEGHEITIRDLIKASSTRPFILSHIPASGTPVDDAVSQDSGFGSMKLSHIRELLSAWRNRFKG